MPWTVEFVPETEILHIVALGKIYNHDARAQAIEGVALVKKHDADLILADYSEVTLEVSLANLYWLPEYYNELGAPQHVRVALILPSSGFQFDSYKFFQTACKNAGYNVKLFDSKEAGEAWLRRFHTEPSAI